MHLSPASILVALSWVSKVNSIPTTRPGLQSFDLPVFRDPDYGFLANISIGTPPQRITSLVDWTWTSQYVISTTCNGTISDPDVCYSAQQAKFNASRSTTYRNESKKYPSQSWYPNVFLPAPFKVDFASDVETIGPVSSRVVIQTSDFQPGYFTSLLLPFSGILGLMPSLPGDKASTQAPIYQQYLSGAWPQPYTAFTLCPSLSCPPGVDGIQTIGGYNKALTSKGLTWYKVVSVPLVNELAFPFSPGIFSYWAVELTSLSIGNHKQTLNTSMAGRPAAIFNHASRGRGVPLSTNAYANLVTQAKAALLPASSAALAVPPNNGGGNFYSVDCNKIGDLPTLKYKFAGSNKTWEIKGNAYVVRRENVCIMNVRTVGQGDFQYGNFGELFLIGKYVVFDFELRRVGLATL